MSPIRPRTSVIFFAGLGLGALGLAGCGAAAASSGRTPGPAQLSIVVHQTQLEFLTSAGASSQMPKGPLVVGDRVFGRDDLLQAGSLVGQDYEVCTVTFDRHVACDDMLLMANQGDLHVTWAFQWPASGRSGPRAFDGVVDGGSAAYRNARGDFHAVTLANGDLQLTAVITR